MKTHSNPALTCVAFLAFGLSALAETDKAELTVTYSNLPQLVSSLTPDYTPAPPQPPVDALVRNAIYQVDLKNTGVAKITATFATSTFTEQWSRLPLLSSQYAIQSVLPETATLSPTADTLDHLQLGKGNHEINIQLLASATADEKINLPFLPATSAEVHFANTEGLSITGLTPSSENHFIIPPQGTTLSVSPLTKTPVVKLKDSVWSANVQTLYRISDNELRGEARIQLTAEEQGSGLKASLILPKNSRIIDATSPDLSTWKAVHTQGEHSINLHWQNQGITRRRLTLHFTLPLRNLDENWQLSLPRLADSEKTRGQLALIHPDNYTPASQEKHTIVNLEQTPAWMKKDGIPYALKLNQAQPITLQFKKLNQLETATATIKSAHFETQIVPDGSTLSKGAIKIDHKEPQFWEFNLPKNCEILNCSINGKATNPITLDSGTLRVALPATHQSSTIVSLSFTSKLAEIAPLEGKLSLALPSTPLFIHELTWDITLPPTYEATAVDGNLGFRSQRKHTKKLSLIKRLSRNQAAQTSIFYRKHN